MLKPTSMALALGLAAFAAPAHAVVVNGDFEDTRTSTPNEGLVNRQELGELATLPGKTWDVFTTIPGWTTSAGAGIEVQANGTIRGFNANSGSHYVELDSHPNAESNITNSMMEQEITLASGIYQLDFFYSPRTSDVGTNGIEYSVFSQSSSQLLAGSVTGPSATTSVGTWTQVFSTLFPVLSSDSPIILKFLATGSEDTLGGFIDDVSLTRISAVPLPAAGPLLLIGVAGLGFLSRRRKAAATA